MFTGHAFDLYPLLTYEHCKNRVENALNRLEGVSAKVNLKKKTAVVSMEKEVEDMQLQKAVEQAGYKVIQIR
jgi:copper chaperone CopZ